MACGTPVVASNNTAIPEISGDAALLVHPRSVDQNVEAVEAVLNDGQLQANLRNQGKKRAAAFTWSSSAAQLYRIYSELM
jgi:glycosyltransferase involved in cell wall biosynthesis